MPTPDPSTQSNAQRGLETHPDLTNPCGPHLSHREKPLPILERKPVAKRRKKSRKKA